MGKSKSSKRRETPDFASRRLPDESKPYRLSRFDAERQQNFNFQPLREVQDLREYHPERPSPRSQIRQIGPREFKKQSRAMSGVNRDALAALNDAVGGPFEVMADRPHSVVRKDIICARRRMRREVLHALKRTRGGGGGRRNWKSKVRC